MNVLDFLNGVANSYKRFAEFLQARLRLSRRVAGALAGIAIAVVLAAAASYSLWLPPLRQSVSDLYCEKESWTNPDTDRFSILVAGFYGDENRNVQTAVRKALDDQFRTEDSYSVEVVTECVLLSHAIGESRDEQGRLRSRAQGLLEKANADVVVWGKVLDPAKGIVEIDLWQSHESDAQADLNRNGVNVVLSNRDSIEDPKLFKWVGAAIATEAIKAEASEKGNEIFEKLYPLLNKRLIPLMGSLKSGFDLQDAATLIEQFAISSTIVGPDKNDKAMLQKAVDVTKGLTTDPGFPKLDPHIRFLAYVDLGMVLTARAQTEQNLIQGEPNGYKRSLLEESERDFEKAKVVARDPGASVSQTDLMPLDLYQGNAEENLAEIGRGAAAKAAFAAAAAHYQHYIASFEALSAHAPELAKPLRDSWAQTEDVLALTILRETYDGSATPGDLERASQALDAAMKLRNRFGVRRDWGVSLLRMGLLYQVAARAKLLQSPYLKATACYAAAKKVLWPDSPGLFGEALHELDNIGMDRSSPQAKPEQAIGDWQCALPSAADMHAI